MMLRSAPRCAVRPAFPSLRSFPCPPSLPRSFSFSISMRSFAASASIADMKAPSSSSSRGRPRKTQASTSRSSSPGRSISKTTTKAVEEEQDEETKGKGQAPRTIYVNKAAKIKAANDNADLLEEAISKAEGKQKGKKKGRKQKEEEAMISEPKKKEVESKLPVEEVKEEDGEEGEESEENLTPQEKMVSKILDNIIAKQKLKKPKKPREPLTKEQEEMSVKWEKLGIDKRLCDAMASLNMQEPFPVQHMGVPELMKGGDVILSAETGTGKTFTYLLPIINSFMEQAKEPGWEMKVKEKHTRAIVLVPNRDLGAQAAAMSVARAADWRLITAEVLPGQKVEKQAKLLQRAPDITIATPARLAQHRAEKAVMYNDVQWVVIDEVDTLLQEGFVEFLDRILQPLLGIRQGRKGSPPLNFVFVSATVSRDVLRSIQKHFPNARTVFTETVGTVSSKVQHEFILTSRDDEKLGRLLEVMKNDAKENRALVFCNTVGRCDRVRSHLVDAGFPSECFHGGLKPKLRFRHLAAMHKGDLRALIATEIASRGLDTLNVTRVINYDCPLDASEHLRKAGRTGRAGRDGVVTTFYLPNEKPLADALDVAIKAGASLSTVRQRIAKQVAPPPPSKRVEFKPPAPPMPRDRKALPKKFKNRNKQRQEGKSHEKRGGEEKKKEWNKREDRRGPRPARKGPTPKPSKKTPKQEAFDEDD